MAKECVFRTAYGPKRRDVVIDQTGEQSLTKQSFKDECDINRIMARYQVTGMIDFVQKRVPQFLDCTAIDFQKSMDIVVQAQEMFSELP